MPVGKTPGTTISRWLGCKQVLNAQDRPRGKYQPCQGNGSSWWWQHQAGCQVGCSRGGATSILSSTLSPQLQLFFLHNTRCKTRGGEHLSQAALGARIGNQVRREAELLMGRIEDDGADVASMQEALTSQWLGI